MRWKVGRAGKLIGIVMVSITHGAEVQMWLEDAMIRVMRQTPPHETTDLRLHAARGEWEPFQVVLTGPAEAWRGARVRASELRGSDGTTLPAPQVWREHYVTVEKASLHAPLPPGDYPDALVPQDFPEAPPPSADTLNQPFWVDVKVPYAVPAQRYRGAVEAQLTDGTVLRREYELEVWDFDLPVTPSLRSSFWLSPHRVAELHGFGRAQENPPPELAQLLEAYATLLAEHRLSIFQMWATARTRGDQLDTEAVEPVLRRQLLHRHAACLAVPLAEDWPFSDPLGRDRPALKRYLADWVHLLEKIHAPGRTYLALGSLDEPNDAAGYERVRRWGALVDEAEQQHGIRLPLMVTEQPVPDDPTWGDLIGAADIWVPHFSAVYEDLESPDGKREIARRLAAGEEVWTYAALAQFSDSWMCAHDRPAIVQEGHPPAWVTDYPPINHRIVPWLMALHGLTGLTYWDLLHFPPEVDPWQQAGTLSDPQTGAVFNGDGCLLYAATPDRFGVQQPVASIRLKWLREAAEDFDYLTLAQQAGHGEQARAWTETFARGFGDWSDDVPALQAARLALGRRLGGHGEDAPAQREVIRPAQPVKAP